MRSISPNAMAELSREFGLESIIIVRVYWNNQTYVDYTEKREGLSNYNIEGRILSTTGLSDVIEIGSTVSISVTLDDSDGALKQIINNTDIHKKRVQVLQWFWGLPKSEAFVLCTGQINSPMEWSEGNRTLSFSILNVVENREFGFSLEEGIFSAIPSKAYGKPFPIVFGRALKVPALQLSEAPSGILAEGFAWVYKDVYDEEISKLSVEVGKATQLSREAYLNGVNLARIAALYNDGDPGDEYQGDLGQLYNPNNYPDDYSQYQSYYNASQQAYKQSHDYALQGGEINGQISTINADYNQKLKYAKKQVQIASTSFPRGQELVVEINDHRFKATFAGSVMQIGPEVVTTTERPQTAFFRGFQNGEYSNSYEAKKNKTKFKWFDAGSRIRVLSVPMYFVAALGLNTQVTTVYGRSKGVRMMLPPSLFSIETVPFTNEQGRTLWAKVVKLNCPLTSLRDANGETVWDSDEIWCDITGEVGSQFIDIMLYAVTMFTDLQYDPGSWGMTRVQTFNNPMNFVMNTRKNTLDFIKELCYQARCAVWINDNKVFLRYLPVDPTPIDTITPDDVVENSLTVSSTETEDLVTKTVAEWVAEHDQENVNKIIVRYNVEKYGIHEEAYTYYAYNTYELVQRAATFWAIRKGTTWKKLSFKTFVNKLKIEAQDAVTFSGFGDLFACDGIVGIVESSTYDSGNNTIDMTVWLPVRWGEFCKYDLAYTATSLALFGDPNAGEYQTGNPFSKVQDQTGFLGRVAAGFQSIGPQPPIRSPWLYPVADSPPTIDIGAATAILPSFFTDPFGMAFRPEGLLSANDYTEYEVKTLTPISVDTGTANAANVDIGTVISASDDGKTYTVQPVGSTGTVSVKQLLIADGYKIATGTPVYIVKKSGIWYMQSPVWAKS